MTEMQTDAYLVAGSLVRFLQRDPAAGYCLVKALVAPGAGQPPNRHPTDDEAFIALDGTFQFGFGSKTWIAGTGEFVRVPLGEVHTFKNIGDEPGRLLVLNRPGTLHVNFFSQAGEPMPAGTQHLPNPLPAPNVPRLLEVGERYGMEFLHPES
jgi:mannose-6-phosphate isomerase-like protein (cupin superfamily)